MLCSLFWVLFKSIVVIYHEKEKVGCYNFYCMLLPECLFLFLFFWLKSSAGVESGAKRLKPYLASRPELGLRGDIVEENSLRHSLIPVSSQAPLCRPWDRGDLMRRLATFKSMTWFGKPKVWFLFQFFWCSFGTCSCFKLMEAVYHSMIMIYDFYLKILFHF